MRPDAWDGVHQGDRWTPQDAGHAPRRRQTAELKSLVLFECARAGASVANVALAHGLNANLVHKWGRRADQGGVAGLPVREADAFIPLTLPPGPTPAAGDIRFELRSGPIVVTWPMAAMSDCAAWLREALK